MSVQKRGGFPAFVLVTEWQEIPVSVFAVRGAADEESLNPNAARAVFPSDGRIVIHSAGQVKAEASLSLTPHNKNHGR